MDFLIKFLSDSSFTQNIYNVMAIIGFFISIFLAANKLLNRRKRISVKIFDCRRYNGDFQITSYVQNKSNSPICISSIELINKGNHYPCYLLSKKIAGSKIDIKTTEFPINFTPLEGRNLVLEFPRCQDIELTPDSKVDLQIFSNRGRITVSSIQLNQSYYLNPIH